MRVWLIRLRTALAALAAVFLIWELPAVVEMMSSPKQGLGGQAQVTTVLRVWLCEDWSGTSMQWLSGQAAAFEKANKGVRVVVRRAQKGDWQVDNTVPPDVLLFDADTMGDPTGVLLPLTGTYELTPAVHSAGNWRGIPYAVTLGYGGYVRLINENKPDGAELVMQSDADYQEFVHEKAGILIATVREARKLAALEAAGKGFAFRTEPYGTKTDRLLMAGRMAQEGDRALLSERFIAFLLSPDAQNALPGQGILPSSLYAQPPDEGKQPVLYALGKVIDQAANAFDEHRANGVQ